MAVTLSLTAKLRRVKLEDFSPKEFFSGANFLESANSMKETQFKVKPVGKNFQGLGELVEI